MVNPWSPEWCCWEVTGNMPLEGMDGGTSVSLYLLASDGSVFASPCVPNMGGQSTEASSQGASSLALEPPDP